MGHSIGSRKATLSMMLGRFIGLVWDGSAASIARNRSAGVVFSIACRVSNSSGVIGGSGQGGSTCQFISNLRVFFSDLAAIEVVDFD